MVCLEELVVEVLKSESEDLVAGLDKHGARGEIILVARRPRSTGLSQVQHLDFEQSGFAKAISMEN